MGDYLPMRLVTLRYITNLEKIIIIKNNPHIKVQTLDHTNKETNNLIQEN